MKFGLFIFFFVLTFSNLLAQNDEEITKKLILKIESVTITKENQEVIKKMIIELDSLIKLQNNEWFTAKSFLINGQYQYFKNELEVAQSNYIRAKSIFTRLQDDSQLAWTHILLANLLDKKGDTKAATYNHLTAINLIENSKNKNLKYLAIANRGLGVIFGRVNDYDKSLYYKKRAFELAKNIPEQEALSYYTSLATTYGYKFEKFKIKSDLDSSYKIAFEGYKIAKKVKNLSQQGKLLSLLIFYNLNTKEYLKAEKLAQEEIEIGYKIDETILMTGFNDKVEAMIGQQKYEEAKQWSDSLITKAKTKKNTFYEYYLRKGIEQRYLLHSEAKEYKLALEYAVQFMGLKDSLQISEKAQAITELETKYETEKKQRAIQLLTAQNQAKEAEIKQKNYLILAITLAVFILLGSFFFWNRQRNLKEKQQAAEMKQRLLRAQLNPHFLFNCLNSIQRLYIDGKTAQANDFIADFAQLMRDILEKTSRTTIPLYEEMDFIEAYLSLEKRRLGDKFDYEIIMNDEIKNADFVVPSFIVQPLVENALLHGVLPKNQKGKIEISVNQLSDESLSISVKDDGVGFYHSMKKAGKHTSKGMELIKTRLGKNGKMLIKEIKNLNNEILGSEVELVLNT